ncbi:hypothetical protein R4Y45_01585 [Holzapfeliella sp. He02]|uniref:Uncharacterized protein n=1 Tax=Holzapfeliella saturejae TaxID=3082953 RepID=A0ABU8SEW3_9LACO
MKDDKVIVALTVGFIIFIVLLVLSLVGFFDSLYWLRMVATASITSLVAIGTRKLFELKAQHKS